MVAYTTSAISILLMLLSTMLCSFPKVTKAGIEIWILSSQEIERFEARRSLKDVTLPLDFIHVQWNHPIYSEEAGSFSSIWWTHGLCYNFLPTLYY